MEELRLFASTWSAASEYRRALDEEFRFDDRGTAWSVPPQFETGTLRADQSQAACHFYFETEDCTFLGKYQDLVAIYRTSASVITKEQIWRVIQAIDGRLSTS
jgi:hypothetical protein